MNNAPSLPSPALHRFDVAVSADAAGRVFVEVTVTRRWQSEPCDGFAFSVPVDVTWNVPSLREFPGTDCERIEWSRARWECSVREGKVSEFIALLRAAGALPSDADVLRAWREHEGDVALWSHEGDRRDQAVADLAAW